MSLYLGIQKRSFSYLCCSVVIFCSLSAYKVYKNFSTYNDAHIYVYDVAPHCIVCYTQGKKAILFTNNILNEYTWHYKQDISPSLAYIGINNISQMPWAQLENINEKVGAIAYHKNGVILFCCRNKKVVCITKPCKKLFQWRKKLKIDVLVVEKDAVQNLNDWLKFSPKLVVIGATNSDKTTNILTSQAKKAGVNFHIICKQGAWVL